MVLADNLDNFNFGLITVNIDGDILYTNKIGKELLQIENSMVRDRKILSLIPNSNIISLIKRQSTMLSIIEFDKDLILVEMPNSDKITGTILLFKEKDYQEFHEYFGSISKPSEDLESLMNLSGELVTITNSEGIVLRVSAKCESMMGIKEQEFVGSSAFDLQNQGFLNCSSTVQVIKTGKMCEITQITKAGKRLFVRGYPIFDTDGKLKKVINLSRDITEEYKLKTSLEETKQLVNFYQNQLTKMQAKDKDFIIKSKSMLEIRELAHRIADVDATVLLLGESGVGKDVIAHMIHEISTRRNHPFVRINCGAIPENLIESELFGYSKGTFTGGNREGKQGLFVAANKGTLFLDEIGDLPYNLQVKLLQAIQEKQITPLGETTPVEIDVRIIAATNQDLELLVSENKFRKDLYYRLNVLPIHIPPLRKRKDDIPLLIDHFLKKFNKKYNDVKIIDKEVIRLLVEDKWEGNVRELENTIERLVITTPGNQIKIQHLPEDKLKKELDASLSGTGLKEMMDAYEKRILIKAAEHSSSLKEISENLQVDISTISRKVKKHGINIAKTQNVLQNGK